MVGRGVLRCCPATAARNRSLTRNRGVGSLTTALSAVNCARTAWDESRTSHVAMRGSDFVTVKTWADPLLLLAHEKDKRFCTERWKRNTSNLNPSARPRSWLVNPAKLIEIASSSDGCSPCGF